MKHIDRQSDPHKGGVLATLADWHSDDDVWGSHYLCGWTELEKPTLFI